MSTPPMADKILVVYFSHTGNTRQMAEMIQAATNADLFQIETVQKYPSDYNTVVDQAKKELEKKFRPPLKNSCDSIQKYEVVFVGSPCWWGTMGTAVMTFLEGVDLAGKTVVPFMTHEGSGLGRTMADMKKLCPKSNFLKGNAIVGSRIQNSQDSVKNWLQEIGVVAK